MLLSWAVPKGPSLDPKTKRLAMKVEDHPFEYGEFEGVIPEGYGAGIVMLWDRGTWTPEADDVDAALKKGDLKFTLNGYKLKGSWVLVAHRRPLSPARGGGDARRRRSWLLIKHRDDWAGELDITEFAPKSVKSDGDFEDILGEDTPAVWLSNRPGQGRRRRRDARDDHRARGEAEGRTQRTKRHEATRRATKTREEREEHEEPPKTTHVTASKQALER